MLLAISSIILTVAGAYFFFLAGMNYMGSYATGALIPFRNATLKAGACGIILLASPYILYLFK